MTNQVITQVRKEKPVQRIRGGPEGHYWVQSDTYKQLSYKVVLTDNDMYCACDYFKHKKAMYKHLLRIMRLIDGV